MRGTFFLAIICAIVLKIEAYYDEKEEKLPTKCHVCKHMTRELSEELGRSGKKSEVLYMGQVFQKEPKKIPYKQSELRLVEALEDACSNVLDYKVHKDKPLALRYEKVESVTFKTLKGLKKRGVKVDLGFPDQMWDSPDAEVTRLKSRCEQMVETYEEEISMWYWNLPDTNLTEWLCVERVLDEGEDNCLNETVPEKNEKNETQKEEKDGDIKTKETKDKEDETEEEIKKEHKKKEKTKTKEKKEKTKEKSKTKASETEHKTAEKRDEENDSDKIQRLIREQAKEQARDRYRHDRHRPDGRGGSGDMDETKRKKLRDRLLAIRDSERLRREIRKIRTKELTEEEYVPPEPWEDRMDHHIPAEVRRDMRKSYDRLENADDFQREIEMRALDLDSDTHFYENFAISDVIHFYLDEARNIRDKKELRNRLEDLEALSAILGREKNGRHDEL